LDGNPPERTAMGTIPPKRSPRQRPDLTSSSAPADSGSRTPEAPDRPRKPRRWWPEPSTPLGAIFYAALGSVIFWFVSYVLAHVYIHIYLSWH
jgi:hypothetical protein